MQTLTLSTDPNTPPPLMQTLTQLMRQHGNNLILGAVLQEGVIENDALVVPEAVPAGPCSGMQGRQR